MLKNSAWVIRERSTTRFKLSFSTELAYTCRSKLENDSPLPIHFILLAALFTSDGRCWLSGSWFIALESAWS